MQGLKKRVTAFLLAVVILCTSFFGSYRTAYAMGALATYGTAAVVLTLLGALGITLTGVSESDKERFVAEVEQRVLQYAKFANVDTWSPEEIDGIISAKWNKFVDDCKDGLMYGWEWWMDFFKSAASDIYAGELPVSGDIPSIDVGTALYYSNINQYKDLYVYRFSAMAEGNICAYYDDLSKRKVVGVSTFPMKGEFDLIRPDRKVTRDIEYGFNTNSDRGRYVTFALAVPDFDMKLLYCNIPIVDSKEAALNYIFSGDEKYLDGAIALPYPDSPAIPWDDVIGKNGDIADENEKQGSLDDVKVIAPGGVIALPSDQAWTDANTKDKPLVITPDIAIPSINDKVIDLTDGNTKPKPKPDSDKDKPIPAPPPAAGGFTADLRKLFPFCIPFDIVDAMKVLNAPAVAPRFSLPIKMDYGKLHVNQEFVVDMGKFDGIIRIFRVGQTILFIIGLAFVTRKLIGG